MASEGKHTAGPWQKVGNQARTAGPGFAIATVKWLGSNEETEANAHLIAAAPELLIRVKDRMSLCICTLESKARQAKCGACAADRAAIAKAEGKP